MIAKKIRTYALVVGLIVGVAGVNAWARYSQEPTFDPMNSVLAQSNQTYAEAYCWQLQGGSYRCYGPTQLLMSGWTPLSRALEMSGCRNGQGRGYMYGAGVRNGTWFTCMGTRPEGWHNSRQKIAAWVAQQ